MVLSVVIHDFDLGWAFWSPEETNTPLCIDPDAVLLLPIACEFFKVVARWTTQEIQRGRGIQLSQLAFGSMLDACESTCIASLEKVLGFLAQKGLDCHVVTILCGLPGSGKLPARQ